MQSDGNIFCTDGGDDLPAFEKAGISATVSNARAEVQERADIIGGSYDELGVLVEIKRILGMK